MGSRDLGFKVVGLCPPPPPPLSYSFRDIAGKVAIAIDPSARMPAGPNRSTVSQDNSTETVTKRCSLIT